MGLESEGKGSSAALSNGPDPRFYETQAPAGLKELARLTDATVLGGHDPERFVRRVAGLENADSESVTFLSDIRYASKLGLTGAGACFVGTAEATKGAEGCILLATALPQAAYAIAAERLHRPRLHPPGSASVHPDADLEEGVVIAPGATVGPGAMIGRGAYISAGAVIGPGVSIGRDGYVGPGAVIGFALVGDRVRIYAGAVVGEAGFGATAGPRGVVDIPQLGRVIIQDGVTIGANSCVDRGALDDTVIGENTKIDNLVQVAHNVVIGRNCVIAAHTGLSGSVVVGEGCMLGGRVGVADHVTIGPGARIAAAAGLMRDIPAGETWGGYPARPFRAWMRETAWTSSMARRPANRKG
jgi:UDP-3-O-[3-hydroxymyristoyl] glucosamine N-acyltransferase